MVADAAAFFVSFRHSSLSLQVLCISMFVISVFMLILFVYLLRVLPRFLFPLTVPCTIVTMMSHFLSYVYTCSGRINVAPDRNLINPRHVLVDFTDPTIYPATTPPPVVGPKRLSDSSTTALIVTPLLVLAGIVVGGVTHCYYNEQYA